MARVVRLTGLPTHRRLHLRCVRRAHQRLLLPTRTPILGHAPDLAVAPVRAPAPPTAPARRARFRGVRVVRHRLRKSIVELPAPLRLIRLQAILVRPRLAAVVIAGVLPAVAARAL